MEDVERTSFLRPKDPDREPNEPNLRNPEIANWAEIDPELEKEMIDGFNRSLERNRNNPNVLQRLVRVAAILGILGGGLYIDKNYNESKIQEGAKEFTSSLLNNANEVNGSQTFEQQQALEAMEREQMQAEAEAFHKEQLASESLTEKENLANTNQTQQVPSSVINQNFEGLDTTKIE